MPLGASRLTLLAFQASVAADATVIRKKVGISAIGNAQIDTAQYKFSGSSALFDGSGDYLITSGDIGDKIDDSDFTAECFIRYNSIPPAGSSYSKIFDNRRAAFGNFGWQVYANATHYTVSYRGTGSTTNAVINQSATISTATWYHLALVKKDTTLTLYIDGSELGNVSIANTTYADSGEDLWIGCGHNVADFVDGHIDQVRISNTARYTTENFQANGPFVNDDNTLLLLQMDGTDGSTFFNDENSSVTTEFNEDDYASNLKLAVPFNDVNGVNDVAKDITGTGITSAATVTQGTCSVVSGGAYWNSYNSSLINNNTGDSGLTYVPASAFGNASSASYTVEVWVRATDATSNNNWALSSADSGGRWLFGINTGSSYSFGNENNIGLGDTEWHHIAIVNNAGTHLFYTDGVYKGAWYSVNTGFSTLHVGQFQSASVNEFQGNMQDLRVYGNAKYTGTDASNPNFALPKPIVKKDPQSVNFVANGNAQLTTSTSQFGNSCLLLDGTGDYVKHTGVLDTGDFYHMQGAFTMELWYKPESDTGGATAALATIGTGNGATNYAVGLFHRNFDMKPQVVFCPYSREDSSHQSIFVIGGSAVSANTWNHIAMASDGSSFSCWLNGTRMNNTSLTGSGPLEFGSNGNVTIGGNDGNALVFNQGGNGYIDEFRIHKSDVYGVSNSSISVPTAPFVPDSQTKALLHFDGTNGQTDIVTDTGVTRAQVSQNAIGNTQISTTQNQFGGASAVFDGSGDYLISNGPNLGAGEWSIEMWARFDSVAGVRVLYDDRESANTASGTILLYTNGTTLYFNSQQVNKISGGTLATNTWYHIAVTRDSSNDVRMFLDGTEIGTSYNDTSTFAQQDGNAFFGMNHQSPNNHFFDGYIDEVRFSNTARYTSGFTPSTENFQNDANTLLLLHMDGSNSSTTIIDDNGKEA